MRTYRNLSNSVSNFVDRRVHVRVPVKAVAYVDLGHENGGLILNLSEGGVAMHVAEIVEGASFEKMRFQLPNSDRWIEAGGKLVWHGRARKKAGVRFVKLSDEARRQIREWADSADVHSDPAVGDVGPNEGREDAGVARAEDSRDAASEFDLGFPSENPDEAEVRVGHAPIPRGFPLADEPESAPNEAPQHEVKRHQATPKEAARHAGNVEQDKVEPGAAPTRERESREKEKQAVAPQAAAERDGVDASRKAPWNAPCNSMFEPHPRPDPFSDVEYRVGGSEGWSSNTWLAVAVVALGVFVVGGVLAMGPANVKALFARRAPASVNAPSQASAAASAPAEPTPPAENVPSTTDAAQAKANVSAPAKNGTEAADNASSDQDAQPAERKSPLGAAEQAPPAKADIATHPESGDDAESAEEMTRRFQLEHRDAAAQATTEPVAEINPAPVSAGARETGVAIDRGAASSSEETDARHSSATPAAAPAGLVAVSSRFQAVQGVAPDEFADDGRPVIGKLLSIKQPVYPAEALREHVEGTVQLRVVVDQIGRVEAVYVVGGPPLLVPAAISAVREWRYAGTVLNSRAVKSVEDVAMVFRLANSVESPRE